MKTTALIILILFSGFCKGQYSHEMGLVSASYINYLQDFDTLDFNNDGYIDFAVAGEYEDDLLVLLNNGEGNHVKHSLYSFDDNVHVKSICSIDINNDEYMDLALYSWVCFFNPFSGCMEDERTISFFINLNGEDVQLANSVQLEEEDLFIGYDFIKQDANSDGKLDLLISGSNYVFLTTNESILNINEPIIIDDVPRLNEIMKYFDFNNNNENEIVYVEFANNLQYLIVKDSESVDTLLAKPFSILGPIVSSHIMDYNFDGKPDLFLNVSDSILVFTYTVLGWASDFQTVYVNSANFTMDYLSSFSLPNESANFFIVQSDTYPQTISQNTEGIFVNHSIIYNPFKSEMLSEKYIVDTHENDSTYILYAESFVEVGGSVMSESIITSFKGKKEVNSVEYYRNILGDQHGSILFTDDINGDGLEDLICPRSFYLQDSINVETGMSYFATAEPIFKNYSEDNLNLFCFGITDVNNDGRQDFLLAPVANNNDSNRVVCKTYDEQELQSVQFNLNLGSNSNYAYGRIYEEDLDNDSINELIIKSYNGVFNIESADTNFVVLKKIGDEYLPFYYGFETFEDFSVSSGPGLLSLYFSASFCDINHDSFKDVIFIGGQNDVLTFIVYLNNTDCSFQAPQIVQFESEIFSLSAFEISDLNLDGYNDIVIAQSNINGQGFLRVKYGLGDLEFSNPEILIFNENAKIEDFMYIDIDQDGELEILLSTFTSASTFEDSLNHGLRLFKHQFGEYIEEYSFAQSNPPRSFFISESISEPNQIKVFTNDATQKLINSSFADIRSEVSQYVLTKDFTTQTKTISNRMKDILVVFPNPGVFDFTLNLNGVESSNYFIFNTIGQLVSQGKISESNQFFVDLSNGLYIIQVNNKHAIFSVVH